jgi:hypothetical protein
MTRQDVLDLYFLQARHQLIEIAAFMDRVERASGTADFRWTAFQDALKELGGGSVADAGGSGANGRTQKAERTLLVFSDPTREPIAAATTKAACGAYPVHA